MERKTIGIIGDGQLAKMLIEAGRSYNCNFKVLGKEDSICNDNLYIKGDFNNGEDIVKLSEVCDVITYDLENVNSSILRFIEEDRGRSVIPHPKVLHTIQSKIEQHRFYVSKNLKVPKGGNFLEVGEEYVSMGKEFILKCDKGGYNGKGVFTVKEEDIWTWSDYWECDKQQENYLVQEKVDIDKEIGVIVCRDNFGNIFAYRPSEMIFDKDGILIYQRTGSLSEELEERASSLAVEVVKKLDGVGVFGVELFLDKKGELLINETAPRTHNCGHHTIDFCNVSQFEQLVRILIGLPLIEAEEKFRVCTMFNILAPPIIGKKEYVFDYDQFYSDTDEFPDGFLNLKLYGKRYITAKRKMGHLTILNYLHYDNDMSWDEYFIYEGEEKKEEEKPLVGVIMGSMSDFKVMNECISSLGRMKIPHRVDIVSAHRTPDSMRDYAKNAKNEGLKVIIAAAGGAAHLPGMTAAYTTLPVIGVPIKTSTMNGLDSLYSIVQMPRGVPVATVAINGAENAAILSAQILGRYTEEYKTIMEALVGEMNGDLRCEIEERMECFDCGVKISSSSTRRCSDGKDRCPKCY